MYLSHASILIPQGCIWEETSLSTGDLEVSDRIGLMKERAASKSPMKHRARPHTTYTSQPYSLDVESLKKQLKFRKSKITELRIRLQENKVSKSRNHKMMRMADDNQQLLKISNQKIQEYEGIVRMFAKDMEYKDQLIDLFRKQLNEQSEL